MRFGSFSIYSIIIVQFSIVKTNTDVEKGVNESDQFKIRWRYPIKLQSTKNGDFNKNRLRQKNLIFLRVKIPPLALFTLFAVKI